MMRATLPEANGALCLRPFTADDVDRTYGWVTNPWYVEDFAGRARPTPESHERYFQGVLADEGQLFLAVWLRSPGGGRHIGNAGLKYFEGDSCECWYYIGDTTQRGKGYSKEIVRLLCETAWSIDGVGRVRAKVLVENFKSSRALLANGFAEVGTETSPDGRAFYVYERLRGGAPL